MMQLQQVWRSLHFLRVPEKDTNIGLYKGDSLSPIPPEKASGPQADKKKKNKKPVQAAQLIMSVNSNCRIADFLIILLNLLNISYTFSQENALKPTINSPSLSRMHVFPKAFTLIIITETDKSNIFPVQTTVASKKPF